MTINDHDVDAVIAASESRDAADQPAGESCPRCKGSGIRARTKDGAWMRCTCGAAATTANAITRECDELRDMLIAKNRAYGDSALDPVRIFSHASAEEQILVRLDDKISRLARGSDAGEDVTLDLLGYLVLLRIARARAAAKGGDE